MASKKNQLIKDDQWVQKFVRESAFMPFGSLLNAYGQVYRGKDIPFKQFEKEVGELFNLSLSFIDIALMNSTPEVEKVDMTREERIKLGEQWQKQYDLISKVDEIETDKKVGEEKLPIIEV